MSTLGPIKHDLTRTVLAVLVIGLLIVASIWILRPFLAPLIWASMIVIATWPLMMHVQAWLFGRRNLAVIAMSLAFLLLFAIPIAYGVSALVDYLPDLGARLKDVGDWSIPQPPHWVGGLPLVGERIAGAWRDVAALSSAELVQKVAPYGKAVGGWVLAEAGGLGLFVVQLLVTLLLTAVLYAQGETAARGVYRFARRLGGERGERAVTVAGQSVRAVALGIIVTALVQTVLGGIGLAVAGVSYAMLLSAVMFVLCIAQLGPMLVLIPAAIWLYWKGATIAGVALLVWALVIGLLDNLLRPLLIRRGADLPLILIMAGVIGGLIAFGVVGLFVGPVVLAVGYRLILAWMDDETEDCATNAAKPKHAG